MDDPQPATLAILTYNQSAFVDAAIAGALAQDYPALQVIVSDDCSSDDTFARIEAAAALYRGPHCLLVNRTPRNLGTVGHVASVATLATGDLIMLGAGDDISLPERVSVTMAAWRTSGADALYARYHLIDDSGVVTRRDYRFNDRNVGLTSYFRCPVEGSIHGASSAYTKEVLGWIDPSREGLLFEDSFLTFMLHLHGRRIVEIDQPLVLYRQHSGSITNFATTTERGAVDEAERAGARAAANYATMLTFLAEASSGRAFDSVVDRERMTEDKRFFADRARWASMSLVQRLRAIAIHRSPYRFRWMAARLFGTAQLAMIRRARAILARSR